MHDLGLRYGLLLKFDLFDFLIEVAPICVAHDDVEIPFFVLEGAQKLDYAGMIERLQNSGLSNSLIDFLLSHAHDFDLFEHTQLVFAFVENQIAFAKGSLPQNFNFLEVWALHLKYCITNYSIVASLNK